MSKEECCSILHPETLSIAEITSLLSQRGVNLTECPQDKFNLVEIFYSQILPLPQRRYEQNRRGQQLTKSQIQLDKSHPRQVKFDDKKKIRVITSLKRKHADTGEEVSKSNGLVNKPKFSDGSNTTCASAVNFKHKTIKLSSGISSNTCTKTGTISTDREGDDILMDGERKLPTQTNSINKITWP